MKLGAVDLSALEKEIANSCNSVRSESELETFRRDWLGKDGKVKSLFKQLSELSGDAKVEAASKLNSLKATLEGFLETKKDEFLQKSHASKISSEFLDLSLPGHGPGLGSTHPIKLVERRLDEILKPFGLGVVEGPEVETEYYCFDALQIPKHHPARDMQDTFFTDTMHVLRTHTTSIQARELEKGKLPVKIVARGRCYRNEAEDASHQAMFHQYELIWLEPGLRLSHLMAIINHMLKSLYGKERKVRFVHKYYPYTEPSLGAQIDCILCGTKGCAACGGAGWVTMVGSGMISRGVLEEFKYDPETVSGIAFGFGASRLTSQFFETPTLKTLYDNDLRILKNLSWT